MSFFRKLFGKGDPRTSAAQPKPKGPPPVENPDERITCYDKFGQQIQITRQNWRDSILLENIKKAWNNPDELYNLIVGALNDKFVADVEEAAEQLCKIDPIPSRSASIMAIIYLQTERPDKAEKVLTAHIAKHGENGTVLTNLAKAQSALGRSRDSIQTLWHALELDPNQDNGLLWYESIFRERNGDAAGVDALNRVANLPGSWRAQVWIARTLLPEGKIDEAMALYRESLERAGTPPPADLLMQISGALGNQAHLPQIIELVAPRFDPEQHGMMVGNNLIKAFLDTGQLDHARAVVQKLRIMQRPDWKEGLDYWEAEIVKTKLDLAPTDGEDKMATEFLAVEGPVWLKKDHPFAQLVPSKDADTPIVVFCGNSVQMPTGAQQPSAQLSNNSGRMSRAIPLFLAEQFHLQTNARAITLIPWIEGDTGSFLVFGEPIEATMLGNYCRGMFGDQEGLKPPDFAVCTHLVTQGENWTIQARVIRTIDGQCVAEFSYDTAEMAIHRIWDALLSDVKTTLEREAGVALCGTDEHWTHWPELDVYLFRLEQCLAVRCSLIDKGKAGFFHNPTEIIDGLIHLCLQNPKHIPSRALLWRALSALREMDPKLTQSFREKVLKLQNDFPLELDVNPMFTEELEKIFAA